MRSHRFALLISICFAIASGTAFAAFASDLNPEAEESSPTSEVSPSATPTQALAATPTPKIKAPSADWAYVQKQLKLAGLRADFIQSLNKNYEPKDLEEVIRLNVLLFLKKSDYHGVQVTDAAAADVAQFVKDHQKTLKLSTRKYGVDANVIASLLWLESRYGKNLGRFHVPSVYLNLVQAPRKDVQAYLLTQTGRYSETDITPAQRKKIIQRTHDKAKFALGELHALERAYKWKWDLSEDFRGSFSGAFGMPQFLPSSYVHFARAVDPKKQPALDQPDDAILSVGYFLKMHGWRAKKASSHLKALRAYNNSLDYANAILSLAKRSSDV